MRVADAVDTKHRRPVLTVVNWGLVHTTKSVLFYKMCHRQTDLVYVCVQYIWHAFDNHRKMSLVQINARIAHVFMANEIWNKFSQFTIGYVWKTCTFLGMLHI